MIKQFTTTTNNNNNNNNDNNNKTKLSVCLMFTNIIIDLMYVCGLLRLEQLPTTTTTTTTTTIYY